MKTWEIIAVVVGLGVGLILIFPHKITATKLPSIRPVSHKQIKSPRQQTVIRVSQQQTQNCTCDRDGILTGLGCSKIGQPCIELYYKPAHVRTKCPAGTMLMEGGQCVKEWDVQRIYPDAGAV